MTTFLDRILLGAYLGVFTALRNFEKRRKMRPTDRPPRDFFLDQVYPLLDDRALLNLQQWY
jgi:hypothetical protein